MIARLATVSSLALGLAVPAYAAGPGQTSAQTDTDTRIFTAERHC